MAAIILIIVILLFIFIFAMPVTALNRSSEALREVEAMRRELAALRASLERYQAAAGIPAQAHRAPDPAGATPGSAAAVTKPGVQPPERLTGPEAVSPPAPLAAAPPPLPSQAPPAISITQPAAPATASPAPQAAFVPALSPARPPTPPRRPVNLEQFLGVKLFAWVGGFALFLGVVFFVKYAFDRNLIPPAVRTAMGFAVGLGLTGGGLILHRKRNYEVLSRTLCATGMLVLYGVTYAAHALYKFPFFSAVPTFLLMAVITACSFLLAVRLRALEVAFLGMLGGFLAPVLCSTGQDNPAALFTSTALLDIGLLAVARRCRWPFLAAFAAMGTLLTQFGWLNEFFVSGLYGTGWRTWIVAAVFLAFPALFTAALRFDTASDDAGKKSGDNNTAAAGDPPWLGGSALALLGGGLLAAFLALASFSIAERPVLLHGFVLLTQGLVMAVVWMRPVLARAVLAGGALTFLHLLLWTVESLTPELLPWALGSFLIAGLAHVGFILGWERRKGGRAVFSPAAVWIPSLIQILTVLPVFRLHPVPAMLWPFLLGVNVMGIGLAARRGRLAPVLVSGGVTLLNGFLWLRALPADPSAIDVFPPVLAVYILVLLPAMLWLGRHAGPDEKDLAAALPAITAAAPFLLLTAAAATISLANPAPVFLVALLLAAVLLWLSEKDASRSFLFSVALGCMLALETVWLVRSFDAVEPATALAWPVGLHVFFTVWPWLRRERVAGRALPWVVSAASGIGHYLLVYLAMKMFYPDNINGLLPLAFCLPPLLGLAAAHRGLTLPGDSRVRQMAWFGGVALFFITLSIPVQFRREWITLSWALEGAALCWLFRRVPHPGLKLTGAALLTVAFIRMGLNPAVFQYHETGSDPLLNWHLYGYGITAAAQFAGAWWLTPPHHRWNDIPLRALLTTFGGILVFLLLNVEIASYFTPEGSRFITFEFHGNFARDMVTTIAWGLFALGLMIIGFRWRQPAARYAGVGLLAVTLIKLFLHDLAQLGTLHRIGAFIAVALTALVASFLYQRFLNNNGPGGGEGEGAGIGIGSDGDTGHSAGDAGPEGTRSPPACGESGNPDPPQK
ncbi:MAG: DUF2339 domain-containing protein [Verrucomicrobiaceae bacterium]|nr:MAG: DUF2339 domain-containing protein [Verrucomicrobiaceae bacterium]